MSHLIENLTNNPKKVFLIDAIGALITVISLSGILTQFKAYVGVPLNILYYLSAGAFC